MTPKLSPLEQLLANNAKAPAATRATGNGKTQPIGSINITLGGVNLFSRPVWPDSTSETPYLQELNEMALTKSPADVAKVIEILLKKAVIEVNMKKSSDLSLEDLLN